MRLDTLRDGMVAPAAAAPAPCRVPRRPLATIRPRLAPAMRPSTRSLSRRRRGAPCACTGCTAVVLKPPVMIERRDPRRVGASPSRSWTPTPARWPRGSQVVVLVLGVLLAAEHFNPLRGRPPVSAPGVGVGEPRPGRDYRQDEESGGWRTLTAVVQCRFWLLEYPECPPLDFQTRNGVHFYTKEGTRIRIGYVIGSG